MRTISFLLLSAVLLLSCTPLKQMGNSEQHMPFLGDIGNHSKSLLHSEFQKAGSPVLKEPIALSVMEVPFNKAKFKTYAKVKSDLGQKPSFAYIDSLPNKPKYLCLEIADKIGMRETLNDSGNKAVLSYLENEEDYVMISKIALVVDEMQRMQLTSAEALFLVNDANGQITVEAVKGNSKTYCSFTSTEIFDFKVSGFCWGETPYGQKRIETLTSNGESCPRGTERKAYKLDETKDFSKL